MELYSRVSLKDTLGQARVLILWRGHNYSKAKVYY